MVFAKVQTQTTTGNDFSELLPSAQSTAVNLPYRFSEMGKRIVEDNSHIRISASSLQDKTLSYSNYGVPSGQLMKIFCRNLLHMSGLLVSRDKKTSYNFEAISKSFSKSLGDTYREIRQTPSKSEAIVRLVRFRSAVNK